MWTNIKWMLFTMVAPEFILGKALGDLAAAWQCRERMRRFAEEDNVEWGLIHGFYANMGGFVGISEDVAGHEEGQANETSTDPFPLLAQTIYWLRCHERGPEKPPNTEEGSSENKDEHKPKKLAKLPDITAAEIRDKSKGDIFVKIIAVIQVFWVALQIIVRASKGLAISQLEVAVAAFCACAVITYLLLIPKPQNVRVPSRPLMCEPGSIQEVLEGTDLADAALRQAFLPGWQGMEADGVNHVPNDLMLMGFDTSGRAIGTIDDYVFPAYLVGIVFGGIVFGSIHIAAWNLKFPTPIEQKLWRICSILLTTLLPIIFLTPILSRRFGVLYDHAWIMQISNLVVGLLYIAARLFVLVEIFRTLLYLPPGAYISTWASNVPHVS
jgi:hypothetical protein